MTKQQRVTKDLIMLGLYTLKYKVDPMGTMRGRYGTPRVHEFEHKKVIDKYHELAGRMSHEDIFEEFEYGDGEITKRTIQERIL